MCKYILLGSAISPHIQVSFRHVRTPYANHRVLQCFFPSLHIQGCFCAAGTVLRSENSSVCVTPNSCRERCLPVLTISVPIKVLARGRNVCPSQGNRMTNFTRFLANQIVRQYRANAGECRISDVQRTSCAGTFLSIALSLSIHETSPIKIMFICISDHDQLKVLQLCSCYYISSFHL